MAWPRNSATHWFRVAGFLDIMLTCTWLFVNVPLVRPVSLLWFFAQALFGVLFRFLQVVLQTQVVKPVNASLRFSKIIGHLVSDVVQFSQSCVPLLWKVGCQQILIGTTAVKEVMWVLMYYNEWEMVSQKIGCRCISYIYLVHSPSIFSPFVYFTEEGPQHFGKPWSLKNICHPVSTVK